MTFKHIPKIGAIYRTSNGIGFRVLKIAHAEHDAQVEYENIKTKEHYHCRLPAFLERFFLEEPYKPWKSLT